MVYLLCQKMRSQLKSRRTFYGSSVCEIVPWKFFIRTIATIKYIFLSKDDLMSGVSAREPWIWKLIFEIDYQWLNRKITRLNCTLGIMEWCELNLIARWSQITTQHSIHHFKISMLSLIITFADKSICSSKTVDINIEILSVFYPV